MSIIYEQKWDNVYLKMDTESETASTGLHINELTITESFDTGVPYMSMQLLDRAGDITNLTGIDPNGVYNIHFGKNEKETVTIPFQVSTVRESNRVSGAMENVALDISFLEEGWKTFLKGHRSRSWKDSKNSEVLKEIAKESGYYPEVTTTSGNKDIIQPYWSNAKMTSWLASNSTTEVDGITVGGMIYGITTDKRFLAKPINEFYKKYARWAFKLGDDVILDDISFPVATITRESIPQMIGGTAGYNSKHFDYNTKEFVTNNVKYSDSKTTQLSEWAYLSKDLETADHVTYGGRDIDYKHVTEDQLLRLMGGNTMMDITVGGNPNYHIGDKVTILIEGTESTNVLVNEQFSGDYIILRVDHKIRMSEKLFVSELILGRSGVNGLDFKGLAATSGIKQK